MTAREKIIGVLDAHGADCALFLDDVSRQYLTRFAFTDGAVVADRNGTRMLVDSRYFFAAKDAGLSIHHCSIAALPEGTHSWRNRFKTEIISCSSGTSASSVKARRNVITV